MSSLKHRINQLCLSEMDPAAVATSAPILKRKVRENRRSELSEPSLHEQIFDHGLGDLVRRFLKNRPGSQGGAKVDDNYLELFPDLRPEQKTLYKLIEHRAVYLPSRRQHVDLVAMTPAQKAEAAAALQLMGDDCHQRATLIAQLGRLEEAIGYEPPIILPEEDDDLED